MLYSAIYKKIYKKNTDGEGNPFQEKVKSNLELNKKRIKTKEQKQNIK